MNLTIRSLLLPRVKIFYTVIGCALASAVGVLYWLLEYVAPNANHWILVYGNSARTPMFTGFLTLGSFLLTLQSGILSRLKEGYDGEDHARKIDQMRRKGKSVRYYESLRNVGQVIFVNLMLALLPALFQITFGFVQKAWSTSLCVGFGFVTIVLVIYLAIELMRAHHEWFRKIEAERSANRRM